MLWFTDLTEFSIPAGKAYLSPVIDCYDGMPVARTIGTSPDSALANGMLADACSTLKDGEKPIIHPDRGCHYRWPEWIRIRKDNNLTRSTGAKGCSPDNAAAEGFFPAQAGVLPQAQLRGRLDGRVHQHARRLHGPVPGQEDQDGVRTRASWTGGADSVLWHDWW